jgi:hypothetical protein
MIRRLARGPLADFRGRVMKRVKGANPYPPSSPTNPLDQFTPEPGFDPPAPAATAAAPWTDTASSAPTAGTRHVFDRAWKKMIFWCLLCCAAITAVALVWLHPTSTSAETLTGSLRVESDPSGAAVFVDGKPSGSTPVAVNLQRGKHLLTLRLGDLTQELPLMIEPHVSTVHHITWPVEETARQRRGGLRVISDEAGDRIAVDGSDRGVTPLTITGLTPGDHQVVVYSRGQVHRRVIRIERGATASFVISARTIETGVQSGWLAVSAGAPLQVIENGKLLGSTESETIMLPAGEHTFEFVNPALGFDATRAVKIGVGKTERIVLELPLTHISINATPWAQVWLDGESIGDTPIGNLSTVIGSHELIFRHPQLGERRVTAVVTLKEPARVAVDLRKSP